MNREKWLGQGMLAAGLLGAVLGGCGSTGRAGVAPNARDAAAPAATVAGIGTGALPEQARTGRRPGDIVPGRYIVVLKEGVAPDEVTRAHGVKADQVYLGPAGFAGPASEAQAKRLAGDPRVRLVAPDRIVRLIEPAARKSKPPKPPQPPQPPATGDTLPTGVNRVDADATGVPTNLNPSGTATDPAIAVIDTGVGPHSELNVVLQASVFANLFNDDNGHGTHVAGIAAARLDGVGVRGVAPNARIISVKVLDSTGSGLESWVVGGINWVTNNAATYNIRVANMSLGFQGTDPVMDLYIQTSISAGVTYTVAAGNSNMDASSFCPANITPTIAVAAVADYDGLPGGLGTSTTSYGKDDTLATFSNWGTTADVAAPGVSIYSTAPNGGYALMSGTSMASPHVAGAALQYIAGYKQKTGAYPTPAAVANMLRSTGWPAGTTGGYTLNATTQSGTGPLVNVAKLLGL